MLERWALEDGDGATLALCRRAHEGDLAARSEALLLWYGRSHDALPWVTLVELDIVCPDGRVRHFPYFNAVDAASDARMASERGCQFYPEPSRLERDAGPCPGGEHSVRARRS